MQEFNINNKDRDSRHLAGMLEFDEEALETIAVL